MTVRYTELSPDRIRTRPLPPDATLSFTARSKFFATAARRARPARPWEPFPRPASPASRRPARIDQISEALAGRQSRHLHQERSLRTGIESRLRGHQVRRGDRPPVIVTVSWGHRPLPPGAAVISAKRSLPIAILG